MRIGAQFYTVRDFCKTPEDLAQSLRRVADIGYTTVQISGTCAYDPAWLRDRLRENGLKCVITHIPADRIRNETIQVARDHDIFDCQYVGLGHYGFEPTEESYRAFLNGFMPAAAVLRANGKHFMYHNHNGEFQKIGGKTILAKLWEDTAPADLGFTLDTYWVQCGGGDPAWWLEKLTGRVDCIHLKDYAYGAKMAVVGEGNINFDAVFKAAEASGTRYMLVEQDDCNGEDPFECLRRSYEYLKANGFE